MPPMSAPTLATLLARHRRAANLTQEDLAERSGIAVRTIQSLESGTTRSDAWYLSTATATIRSLVTTGSASARTTSSSAR